MRAAEDVVALGLGAKAVAWSDMDARRGNSGVALARESRDSYQGARLDLGAVTLAIGEVGESLLSNVFEVVRCYDELVMRLQCME